MPKKPKPSPDAGELRRRAEGRWREQHSEAVQSAGDYQRLTHELQVHQIELEMQNDELREVQGELEAGLQKYSDLYDFAPVGYLTLDREGTILEANLTSTSLLGIDRSRLVNRHFGLYVSPTSQPVFDGFLARIFASKVSESCDLTLLPEGKPPMEAQIGAMASASGHECRVVVQDITERKQIEERLRQSQKMEGVGHLAGGIAHEFNNILTSLTLNLELVKPLTAGAEVRDLLREMEDLFGRATTLIRQLLAFSRKSVVRIEPTDLAAVVLKQSKLLGRLLGERIVLEFSSGDGPSCVKADKALIEQILLNLCLNARDAMKDGGRLRLHLEEVEVSAEQAKARYNVHPGKHLSLSVSDTGCGMDERTMKRLFEPFFTTKDIGQGTGLGLATVRGIVEQHHGWVEAESVIGKGSTFRVFLPAVAQTLTALPLPASQKPVPPGPGKGIILLVEDDAAVRKMMRTFLARNGYVVLEASHGSEALTLWEQHRSEIGLLFTDMVMPGNLTGLQLAERLLAEKPAMKAIIASGYHRDALGMDKISESPIVYLPKPCAPATLLSTIRECLEHG